MQKNIKINFQIGDLLLTKSTNNLWYIRNIDDVYLTIRYLNTVGKWDIKTEYITKEYTSDSVIEGRYFYYPVKQ